MESKKIKLTKYEYARMLGARALQIAQGAPCLVKVSEEELKKIGYNPIELAKKEIEQGALLVTVKRQLPKQIKEEKPQAA